MDCLVVPRERRRCEEHGQRRPAGGDRLRLSLLREFCSVLVGEPRLNMLCSRRASVGQPDLVLVELAIKLAAFEERELNLGMRLRLREHDLELVALLELLELPLS